MTDALLKRLTASATGAFDLHRSHYRKDCADALAEIERLRAALEELRVLGVQGAPPDYTRWMAFHDKVAEIATEALNQQRMDTK